MKNDNPDRTLTIGLLWHSANSDNLGIGALTASNIAIVRAAAEASNRSVRFKIIGWSDPEPYYINGPDIEHCPIRTRDLFKPQGLYRIVRNCDLVLDISAGDSFADIYGPNRFWKNFLGKLNVIVSRRVLIMSPQTIGPFQRWWVRFLARCSMAAAHTVLTRDSLSSEFVKDLRLGAKVIEATDVAMRLPFERPEENVSEKVRIGLNVSGLLFNGGYTKDNMFALKADYAALTRTLIGEFSKQPNCEVHLIGHVNSRTLAVEDDHRTCEALASEFPGVIVAPRFESPSHAKSYISAMDFFAGARMHACIAAFSAGVPVIPIAYSRKFEGLFGTLGYNHVADCKKLDAGKVIEQVMNGFEMRADLKDEVAEAFGRAKDKLSAYDRLLSDMLRDL